MRLRKGYALLVVLFLMALLFILVAAISMNVKIETDQSLILVDEQEALNGADSGIQYALESVREEKPIPLSFAAAPWNLLQVNMGISVCFKVYEDDSSCASGSRCMMAYGEVVQGGCGNYDNNLSQVMSARIVEGTIDSTSGILTGWEEVLP